MWRLYTKCLWNRRGTTQAESVVAKACCRIIHQVSRFWSK